MASLGNRVVPSLLARDLDETLKFYQQVLGFRVTGFHPTAPGATWAELARDGIILQFFNDPPHGLPETPLFSGTLYFYPDSVAALAKELAGKVPFAWGPEVMSYGMREFAIQDPNGYFLAFTEPA